MDRLCRRVKAYVAQRDRAFYYRADSALTLRFFLGATFSNSTRFVCALGFFSLALFVSAHEYMDNLHHISDVVFGGLIGGVCALFVWGIFEEDDAVDAAASVNGRAEEAARQARALFEERRTGSETHTPPECEMPPCESAGARRSRFPDLARTLK